MAFDLTTVLETVFKKRLDATISYVTVAAFCSYFMTELKEAKHKNEEQGKALIECMAERAAMEAELEAMRTYIINAAKSPDNTAPKTRKPKKK